MDERPALSVPQDLMERLFRRAFAESEQAVAGLDGRHAVATWSRGAAELLARAAPEVVGRPFEELSPTGARPRCRELLEALEPDAPARNVEWALLDGEGNEVRVRLDLHRLRGGGSVVVVYPQAGAGAEWQVEDLALREMLARMQQLGAVGQLAAALAHQIRTPLHVIQSTVELIQDELPAGDSHQEGLRVVNRNIERIEAVLEALRGFVQPRRAAARPGDLNKVVEQACLFIEMLCKKRGIKLKRGLGPVAPVRLDPDSLLGALYNLMANAVEAMPDGGVLTVTTAQRGPEVVLVVADTGRGMPPAVLEQVGKPFFTTKAQGTGLGLFVVRRILDQHRAAMRIESKYEVGTTATVAFPAA